MWKASVCGLIQETNPGKAWHQGCGMAKCKWQEVTTSSSAASTSADARADTTSNPGATSGGNSRDPAVTRLLIRGIAEGPPSSRPDPDAGRAASSSRAGGSATSGARTVTPEVATTTARGETDPSADPDYIAEAMERRLRPTLEAIYRIQPDFRTRLEATFDAAKRLLHSDLGAGKAEMRTINANFVGLLERLEQPKTTRKKNEEVQESITKTNNALAAATEPQRKLISERAAEKVLDRQSAEEIAALPVAEQTKLLASLQCYSPSGAIPEQQKAAMAKIYGAIRLDKDFRTQDKKNRTGLLNDLMGDEDVLAAQATWDKPPDLAGSSAKQKALRRVHELQCTRLGMPYDENNVVFQSMADGSSGLCKDKQVKVSTNPEASKYFNEVLDTIIHETTHVYQHALVEQLDSGKLTVDDPRYAQAWLFKLNDGAYAKSPPKALKTTNEAKYNAEYTAYQRQPVEEHAWKAGSEAGRAFDVNAVALDIAAIVGSLQASLPKEKATEAQSVLEKFQARNDVREGAAALVKLDGLAEEAFGRVKESVRSMIEGMQKTSGLRDSEETFERYKKLVENKEKMSPREKFKQMSELERTLKTKTERGATDEETFKTVSSEAKTLCDTLNDYDRQGYNDLYSQWYGVDNLRIAIHLKLEKMTALKETLEARVRQVKADQQAYDDLVDKIKKVWQVSDQMKVKPIINQTLQQASISQKLAQLKDTAVGKRVASGQ